MYRKFFAYFAVLVAAVMLITACAPTVQTVVVKETQVVKETAVVKETQIVETVKEVQVTAVPVEKGLVEFGGFYPADSPWGRMYRLIGYRFETENPECKFTYSEYPGVEGGKALALRAQEGDPVSIAESAGVTSNGTSANIQQLWDSGLYYDLAKDMQTPAYGQTSGKWLDTFNAAAQQSMVTQDGKIGSIPIQQTNIIMWINQGLYDKYGLKAPTTWDELMANCEVLKKNGVACIGGGGFNGYIGYWYDMLLYRLLGPEKMTKLYQHSDPNITWENTPEVITAANMLNDMIKKGYTSDGFVGGDFTAEQVAFFTNKSAHLFVGTWLIGEMKASIPQDFKMSVGYFPAVKGYENLSPYEAAFGFINPIAVYNPGKNAKQPHDLACAVKYAKLLTSAEVQKEMSGGSNLDYVTTIVGGQGQSAIPGIGELLGGMKQWFPFLAGASYITPETTSKYWDNVAQLAAGTLTPEEFAAKMKADWEDIFSRVK
jgi:raffinose/stachyose/melibiose transport system substrate-binding protein